VIPWLLLAASYLLGAVPASYLAGMWTRGIDLRKHGSGNLGATNTFRVLGPRVAAPVMLFDVLKGWVPAFVFVRLDGTGALEWALAYGAAAIVGHVFPVYMRFRGGKGVATGAGVFLALAPLAVGVGFLVWALTVWRTRMVSLGSILAALALVVVLWTSPYAETAVRILGSGIALFVLLSHRANLGRILRGEEPRFRKAKDPVATATAAVVADAEDVP
jgi:acyl phosphate:glycerol-3-phosphate acyltransferase